MRLEPIAKPIRIRIKLGENECSSLISLQNNFSVGELYPMFKDGRLERWLTQIGETKLASDVNSISEQCGDGSEVYDIVCLISIFFDEFAQVVKDIHQKNKKASIGAFLKKASIEALDIIYKYTKAFESFEWKAEIDKIINNKNIKTLFEHERLHEIFSDESEWGLKFEKLTTNDKDYTDFIIYLRDFVKNNQKHENVLINYFNACKNKYKYDEDIIFRDLDLNSILRDWYSYPVFRKYCETDWSKIVREKLFDIDEAILLYKSPEYSGILGDSWGGIFAGLIQNYNDYRTIFDFVEKISKEPGDYETLVENFINKSREIGYCWETAYEDKLSLKYISRIYTNKYFDKMNLDWGKIFAKSITNWKTQRDKTLHLLEKNAIHLESFCNECIEYGYGIVKKEEIPWFVLAKSNDYYYISLALREKYDRWPLYLKKDEFHYNEIKSELGKQILVFLEATNEIKSLNKYVENLDSKNYYLMSKRIGQELNFIRSLPLLRINVGYGTYHDTIKKIVKKIKNHIDKYRLQL